MGVLKNKMQVQSHIMTTAKYDFDVYEKRVIYRLVELAQCEIQGLKFPDDCRKVEHDLWGYTEVTLPISSLLSGEDDKNHLRVKEALRRLQKKTFEYEDDRVWECISIIALPKIKKWGSSVTFIIDPKIWDACLDFSKGYRKYELKAAMSFKSEYSMRFYEMMSGQKKSIQYSIEKLKDMFGISDRYRDKPTNFIKKVIDPAKKELDKKSPYSFEYKVNKTGRKFTSITFYPVSQPKHRDPDLERKELQIQISPSWYLSRETLDYLKHGFGFDTKEIKQNIDLLKKAQSEMENFVFFMSQVKPRANRANNPKGYLINAIKKELNK